MRGKQLMKSLSHSRKISCMPVLGYDGCARTPSRAAEVHVFEQLKKKLYNNSCI